MKNETKIIQSLVGEVLQDLKYNHVRHVAEIRFRRASTFSEKALRETFDTLIQGTPLQDAKLRIETINITHECRCGHKQVLTSSDVYGQMYVCPVCGRVQKIGDICELEVLKVIAAPQAHVTVAN